MTHHRPSKLPLELGAGLAPMAVLALAFGAWVGAPWMVVITALCLYALLAVALNWLGISRLERLGWPNRITLLRAMLVVLLAAALVEPGIYIEAAWSMAALALIALVLDGVDGWLARTLDRESEFGARFDMEVDAALILILSTGLFLSGTVGAWVLAIGLMRYAFLAATLIRPWLARPLPDSFRRKWVCVWQVTSLLLVTAPLFEPVINLAILISSLLLLIHSFAVDVTWLRRQHHSDPKPNWRMS
jgi:phosphatidylglycerophosphate synthase